MRPLRGLVPILLFASAQASADPRWRIDGALLATGSLELDTASMQARTGVVPSLDARVMRRVGRFHLGGVIGGGFPAFYGRADAALSADIDRELSRPSCEIVRSEPGDLVGSERCTGAHWLVSAGLDAGLGMYYFDAPPETASSSDALLYWGPLVRARVQLHALDVLDNGHAVGVVFGAHAALRSAHYMSTASGTGTRLEPGLDVALELEL